MNDIYVIGGVLTNEECDFIISESERFNRYKASGVTETNETSNYRTSDSVYVSDKEDMNPIGDLIYKGCFSAVKTIMDNVQHLDSLSGLTDEGYHLLRYNKGQEYKKHVDYGTPIPRVLSIIIYLNDDYEGGETEFPRQQAIIKGEKGAAVVFPSIWTHPHAALPIISGTKYVAVTWLK